MNDEQIESILRRAPRPTPPTTLRPQLHAELAPGPLRTRGTPQPTPRITFPRWKRWAPALAFGLLFLGCFLVLALQTNQLLDLRRQNEERSAVASTVSSLQEANEQLRARRASSSPPTGAAAQELETLRAEVNRLRPLTQQLITLRAEQQRLQEATRNNAAGNQTAVPPEDDPFASQKARSQSIACISNLKQIGLAARMWVNDHKTETLPTDVTLFRQELVTPKVLTCPAEAGTTRSPSISWEGFDPGSVSYEFPSRRPSELEPQTVYSRCPVHGHIGLCDGSAVNGDQKPYTVLEDGNLILRRRPENK